MADDRKVDLLLTGLERLILSFFDAEPVSAQPTYVINVDGDCRVLGEMDAVVRWKSLRERMIEAAPATRSLPDRAQAWGRILRKQGLTISRLHEGWASACGVCGRPPRADTFLVPMAQSGLFPDPDSSRCYREAGPASVWTGGLFKLRDYCFRFAVEGDLPTLVRLETECWPPGLGMLPEIVKRRIAGFREGRLVLDADNSALGVVYSQSVRTAEFAGCPDKQHDVLASATLDRAVQTHTSSLKNAYHRQRRRKSALVRSRASGGCRWQQRSM